MNFSTLSTPRKVSVIAIGVVALGAFLPWASVLGMSVNGLEGDGVITLIAAVIGFFVLRSSIGRSGAPKSATSGADVTLVILALGVTILAGYHTNKIGNFAAIGLNLTLIAGITWTISSFIQISSAKAPAGTNYVPPTVPYQAPQSDLGPYTTGQLVQQPPAEPTATTPPPPPPDDVASPDTEGSR